MNLLELTSRVDKIEITIKLSNHTLKNGIIMKVEKIHEIIQDEFDADISFELSANRILSALQPLCYEVKITPPKKGFSYYYTVIARK